MQNQLNRVVISNQQQIENLTNIPAPYFKDNQLSQQTSLRKDIIFINSRFRTGSTILWYIFRKLEGHTAYYEPFNERCWFNKSSRGERVDSTHLGIDDYWNEYNDMEELSQFYNKDWIRYGLHMDKKTWNPEMKAYIDYLIEHAEGRPVLQFNRIDFRMPWLKEHYPYAKTIHLYRNPRDQWLSFLTDKTLMNKNDVHKTYKDAFYLNTWCNDLKKFFPFLAYEYTPHPYQRFYYLWKLSFLYGQKYSDISIEFEQLIQKPQETLQQVFDTLEIKNINWPDILSLIEKPPLDKWKKYAEEEWFLQYETKCETVLSNFFKNNAPSKKP